MVYNPKVLLDYIHLYSEMGDEKKSRYYDKLFTHLMRRSI